MADLIELGGLDDPRLRDYVDLRDVQMRRLLESQHGIFLAEGEKVVRRAVESGHRARSFLMAPRWLDPLADVLEASGAPCFVLDESDIERLTGFHVHRGALASLERRPLPSVEEVLDGARRVVVVEDVVDHTNLGAIFRSVAAFGFDAIVLSPRCADPLYRRAIKVAMGSVFWIPYARVEDWYGFPEVLTRWGFTSLAMTLAPDAVDLREVRPDGPLAVLLGSEGSGLTAHWTRSADIRATIPMAPQVDSLNVAAAAAVTCWALGS